MAHVCPCTLAYDPSLSETVICAAGEQLNDSGECIKLSCSITKDDNGAYKFPIKDARNQPEKLDNGLPNPEHKKVTNVKPGECSNYLTEDYFKKKVASGTSCAMVTAGGLVGHRSA